jgi:hypothetical protein
MQRLGERFPRNVAPANLPINDGAPRKQWPLRNGNLERVAAAEVDLCAPAGARNSVGTLGRSASDKRSGGSDCSRNDCVDHSESKGTSTADRRSFGLPFSATMALPQSRRGFGGSWRIAWHMLASSARRPLEQSTPKRRGSPAELLSPHPSV